MEKELRRQLEEYKGSRHAQVEVSKLIKPQPRIIKSQTRRKPQSDTDWIDQSYDQLDGEWGDWLDTARAYDHSVPKQDQFDLRHDILLELATARARDCQPLPKQRQYRIASLCRINYWRRQGKGQTRVCILSGIARPLHCKDCQHKPKQGLCPWLAVRPTLSLDLEVDDGEGGLTTLADTIADDNALDIEAWTDMAVWRLNAPVRLITIADKIRRELPLTHTERNHLYKLRKKEQKKLV